ncbi:MAG: Sec-independent protein translocase protein TatB [Kiloniellaceae bacterium]
MFDIGWSEMAVIALVALIVIGPKDLPRTMKTVAHWMRKARSLTREFQSGIDEMVREAELEDARKALDATRKGNLERTIGNAIDPDDELGKEVRSVEQEARRKDDAPAKPAETNADKAAAKMVSQPASVAPPHSLNRPAETPAGDKSAGDKPAGGEAAAAQPVSDSKQSA